MHSTCPSCGKYYSHVLDDTWLIVCAQCHHQITNRDIRDATAFEMPDDLSSIQIGTTGIYKTQSFVITGRVRIQLKSDFRNLWCARYADKTIWIGQSLESVGFFTSQFAPYAYKFDGLRAGIFIEFTDSIKLKCEMIEPCVSINYEGEISRFPFPNTKITLLQASNSAGNTMLGFMDGKGDLHYLWGELMLANAYKFDNLTNWAQW